MNNDDYVFYFKKQLKRADKNILDEDFVNDFMYKNELYGEEIYNKLLNELNKYLDA